MGLQVNDTLIVRVTASHRTDLRKVLTPDELANKHLLFFDTTSLLSKIMGDDWPNQPTFRRCSEAGFGRPVKMCGVAGLEKWWPSSGPKVNTGPPFVWKSC